jgi:hypothetical protein
MRVYFGAREQGCQMVCFQTQNPNLGKFWRALDLKMFIKYMSIWDFLSRFGICHDNLVHFVFIWYFFPVLVACTKKHLAALHASLGLRNLPHKVAASDEVSQLCRKFLWAT